VLSKNWLVGLEGANGSSPSNFVEYGGYGILQAEQLSNGLTYGLLGATSGGGPMKEVLFPASGTSPLVVDGNTTSSRGVVMQTDGSLTAYTSSGTTTYSVYITKATLTGFSGTTPTRSAFAPVTATVTTGSYGNTLSSLTDPHITNGWGNGNLAYGLVPTSGGIYPIWSVNPYGVLSSITPDLMYHGLNYAVNDSFSISCASTGTGALGKVTAVDAAGSVLSTTLTSSGSAYLPSSGAAGYFYSLCSTTATTGSGTGLQVDVTEQSLPHLGGINTTATNLLFETNFEQPLSQPDNDGSYPASGGFGGHNGVGLTVSGHFIFAKYDGQSSGPGNVIYIYNDDGLFVASITQDGPAAVRFAQPLTTGQNENISHFGAVTVNGDVYLYETSEVPYSPICRWHVSNLSSVTEMSGVGTIGSTITVQ
jgi:hypothetical protein